MVLLVAAAVFVGPAPGAAVASGCMGWTVLKVPTPGTGPFLNGVAVAPSGHVWAAGWYTNAQGGISTLLMHWIGTGWKQTPTPNPAGLTSDNRLYAVAATSSSNAWAVGAESFTAFNSLLLHWDGTAWTQVPSPPGGLFGVAATSSTNAWAVGMTGARRHSWILHWNGTAWSKEKSPGGRLNGVAATSATNAWAVGSAGNFSWILHWNGTAWKLVPSPDPAGGGQIDLFGVAATSSTNAWAVGDYTTDTMLRPFKTLILHWNGKTWKQVVSPNPNSAGNGLQAVAALSSTNVWAVGSAGLILHWDGTAWKQETSPPNIGSLYGVTAPSATRIWAVNGGNLALHRC
jgi:hypothetical protein